MLYLVINEQGLPDHRWSVNPNKDFQGLKVFGEALKDESGNYLDSAWLVLKNGVPIFDPSLRDLAKKAAIDQIDRANKAIENNVKRREQIKALYETEPSLLLKTLCEYILGES